MPTICLFSLLLWLGAPAVAKAQWLPAKTLVQSRLSRIRPLDERLAKQVAAGYLRSPTFKSVTEQVECLNVLVFLRHQAISSVADGSLQIAGAPYGQKILFVAIQEDLSWDASIAMIGHELQHVIEVGHAPEVVDLPSLRKFYQTIGYPFLAHAYDTKAAQHAGMAILLELKTRMFRGNTEWPDVLPPPPPEELDPLGDHVGDD
jgi:hypothetical protein